jgi:hypothetical protein
MSLSSKEGDEEKTPTQPHIKAAPKTAIVIFIFLSPDKTPP